MVNIKCARSPEQNEIGAKLLGRFGIGIVFITAKHAGAAGLTCYSIPTVPPCYIYYTLNISFIID